MNHGACGVSRWTGDGRTPSSGGVSPGLGFVRWLGLAAALIGCSPATTGSSPPRPVGGAPVRVRSFSDSLPVTCLAAAGGLLWAGTPHGLIRWTPGKSDKDKPTPAVLTTSDGLPADKITALSIDQKGGVWVVTPKGVSRFADGGWTNFPAPPVGDLVAGIVALSDGQVAWAGGSDGIARIREGQWERFASGTVVTAMAGDGSDGVWIGTSGKGVMRVLRDDLLQFGAAEGNEIDNVRGMAAGEGGAVLVVGDAPAGPRAGYFDGSRFYSYRVESPGVLEWVRRAGSELLLGSSQSVWSMKRVGPGTKVTGPVRFTFVGQASVAAPKAQPLKNLVAKDVLIAPTPDDKKTDDLLKAPAKGQGQGQGQGKSKGQGTKKKKGPTEIPATFLRLAPSTDVQAAGPSPIPHAQAADRPWLVAGPGGEGFAAPRFDTDAVNVKLPDGVTSVTSDANALYVGTRFLGTSRIDVAAKGKVTPFRLFDLTAGAERLSVACVSNDECYVATGGAHAWRFDGQSFEITDVDPEKGSHVLSVVRDLNGAVIALHRGNSKEVRISRVGTQGKWAPVGVTSLEVPRGVPEISFAAFSPRGKLWVGLRYTDQDQDIREFGAAEVSIEDGKVMYHRQKPKGAASSASEGVAIPSDVNAIAWRGPDETWLSSKSGAVRVLEDKKVKVFTENDGLESELLNDVVEGLSGQIWIATSRGIGQFDGSKWLFPKGNYYNIKAKALARDPEGRIWVGSDRGVMEVIDDTKRHFIGTRTGLLDDHVLNLQVDVRGRVWTLTEKGISVIEPLQ